MRGLPGLGSIILSYRFPKFGGRRHETLGFVGLDVAQPVDDLAR